MGNQADTPFAVRTDGIIMSELNLTAGEMAKKALHGGLTHDRINEYLRTAPAREIEKFISSSSIRDDSHWFQCAKIALDIRLSEDAAEAADKLIQHTKNLTAQTEIHIQHTEKLTQQTEKLTNLTNVHIQQSVKLTQQTGVLVSESKGISKLTKVLVWLTIALIGIAVAQIGPRCFHNPPSRYRATLGKRFTG